MTHLNLPADAIGHQPNCGLMAMAVASGKSLEEVTEAYQKACEDVRGRRMTGNWRGRTYDVIRDKAMTKYLGMKLSRIPVKGMMLKKLAQWLEPNTVYIVTTTGHCQTLQRIDDDVFVADQRGVVKMDEYWGKGKRVRDVLIVVN